jgi:NAD(P)-dependent dehydrogenase (short-subunit alcohol dehydrogenase family)
VVEHQTLAGRQDFFVGHGLFALHGCLAILVLVGPARPRAAVRADSHSRHLCTDIRANGPDGLPADKAYAKDQADQIERAAEGADSAADLVRAYVTRARENLVNSDFLEGCTIAPLVLEGARESDQLANAGSAAFTLIIESLAFGPIDALVSNAGATVRAPMETVPVDEVQRLFELNTFGALRVAQAVMPAMRERGSGNPYRPLLDQLKGFRSDPVTAQEVAEAVAVTLEASHAPLRIPVGAAATTVLAARKTAPEDVAFLAAPLAW